MPADAGLIAPYGGALVNLIVGDARAAEMKATAKEFASVTLDERGLCDLEQLATGGFSPLTGFLGRADYECVVGEGRLADGTFWPVPIVLPVPPGEGVAEGMTLALRDVFGNLLAFLHVAELYSVEVEGTTRQHAAGRLEVIRVPPHYDFVELRKTPAELRERFGALGWSKVVAYQPRGPMNRADEERAKSAAREVGGGLAILPPVGIPKPGDVEHYTRIRCDRAVFENHFEPGSAELALVTSAPRSSDAREMLLRAIVVRNHGCSHLLIEADAVGTHDRALLHEYESKIGVGLVESGEFVYLPESDRYVPADSIASDVRTLRLTEQQVREVLTRDGELPAWHSRPEVSRILGEAHPPRHRQGLTIWFTGLSGSGKSTVAHALVERLAEFGRNVSFLDGDEIRTHLSKGLGFSKEDRDANINRVGYVAGLVAQHGGTTLCSVVSPYRATRDNARAMSKGSFVEVYCETPIEVCEQRDVKGLYAKARAGEIKGFTGIDDPYEEPLTPEVRLDTSRLGVQECAEEIIQTLIRLGYIRAR